MKKLFLLLIAALATANVSAQKSWTFEEWTDGADSKDFSSNYEKDGLTIHAASGSTVTIDKNSKSFTVDGVSVSATKRLKFGGSSSSTVRHLSFAVDGPSKIFVVYAHSSSSGTNRLLNVSFGNAYNATNLHSQIAVPGAVSIAELEYPLNTATTIYVGCAGAVNLYGIWVKPYTPSDNTDLSSSQTWDFTQALSSNDETNLNADATLWTYDADSGRYSYQQGYDSNGSIANFYGITLMANEQEVELTKGLKFGRETNGSMAAGRFNIDKGKRLNVVGTDNGFIIPNLKRNDIVKVAFSTASTGDERSLILTNATTTDAKSSSDAATPTEVTVKVINDGYVAFRGTNGLNYFYVKVNPSEADAISAPKAAPAATTDAETYNLAGQRVAQPVKGLYIQNGKKVIVK